MRLLLAGLWSRRAMNLSCLLVCVVAMTAAVLGPMYGRASAEHLLDTRLDERAPYTTGLTNQVQALRGGDLPRDDPARYEAPPVDDLVASAGDPFATTGVARWFAAATPWALDRGGSFRFGPTTFVSPLYWRQGMCDLADVRGRCPSTADEALMQATQARTLGLSAGDTFAVTWSDSFLRRSNVSPSPEGLEVHRNRTVRFRLTGTYTVPDPGSPPWFDLSRFTGLDSLVPPPQRGSGSEPTAPALLVAPSAMVSQSFVAGQDRPIRTDRVDLATMADAERTATAFKSAAIDSAAGTEAEVLPDLDLASVVDQVRTERTQLSRVMIAALAPLVLLALLLLHALVSSAAQVRRPQVALAKLRGLSRGQVLWFALAEPFLLVAVAVPVSLALAVAAAHVVARGWLHPGIPVRLDAVGVAGLAVVVGAALVAATVAALGVIREPLAVSLAASVRPRGASRVGLVLRSGVVAVALAAVGNLLASGEQAGQLLALLTPTLVALAVAVGGAALLRLAARWWLRRTARSGGTAGYLASRRLARRPDATGLMVPLLLASAVLTFAASATATSDDWRESRASAEVGAARTYLTSASPGRLLRVTRDVDPGGTRLMAAAVNTAGDDLSRSVFVDASRLGRVAAWDPSWSARSSSSLGSALALHDRRIRFTGREITVALSDVRLRSGTDPRAALQLQYVDQRGEQADLLLGAVRGGARQVLTARLQGCERGCTLEQLYLTGSSAAVSDVQGTLTVAGVRVDGHEVDWRLSRAGAWRAARPFPVSLVDPPVVLDPTPAGLRLRVYLGRLPAGTGPQRAQVSGFARITPATTPDVVPALVAAGTRTPSARQQGSGIAIDYPDATVAGVALNGQQVPMRVVERVRTLPLVGTEGSLSDLETSLVEFDPPAGAVVTTQLLVAEGTPAAVLDRVRAAGITLSEPRSRAVTLHELRTDAFSLGLRLFLVTGLATLLVAVLGVLASAVLQSRWRAYEVASLRVVGVHRRTLLRASVLEHVVLLGLAVVLGCLSAYLSLRLVLPSVSLGTRGEHEPAPAYAGHPLLLLGSAAVLFVLAVLISVAVSRRTTRLGRPSTLRWADQA